MKFEGVIAIVMVFAALVALLIWETGAGTRAGYMLHNAGDHAANDVLGGQDIDAPGPISEAAVDIWASRPDFSADHGYNATPWGPPTWH